MSIIEGRAPFEHPSFDKNAETWYQIHGDLQHSSTGRPLFLVHGGPGATHAYLTPMSTLASRYGITVIFYDQVGCGNSTRFKEKRLDTSFWTPRLFMDELENLCKHLDIKEYDLLGQSWGGMLGADYAITRPSAMKRLIISNSPCDMKLWIKACNECRKELPKDVDETLEKYEREQNYEAQEYKDAVVEFYKRFVCRKGGENGEPFAEPFMNTEKALEEDNTVYFTMNGPSEFTVIGSLKEWSLVGRLHNIQIPTLVINGEFDEARSICVQPFEKEIPGAKWVTIKDASHCSHIEQNQEYCELVHDWLSKV